MVLMAPETIMSEMMMALKLEVISLINDYLYLYSPIIPQ